MIKWKGNTKIGKQILSHPWPVFFFGTPGFHSSHFGNNCYVWSHTIQIGLLLAEESSNAIALAMCVKSWGALRKINDIYTVKLPELIYCNSESVKINTSCVYRGRSTLIITKMKKKKNLCVCFLWNLLLAQMWDVITPAPPSHTCVNYVSGRFALDANYRCHW